MSRALRRHPSSSKQAKQKPIRPTGPRPKRQQQPSEKRGTFSFLRPRWAEEIISELRKVTWPTWEDTRYLTLVVVVVAAAFGLFLGGVDMFFNWMIENTLLR